MELLIEGRDFVATQEMSEELRQDVSYQGAFGVDGPVLRQVRYADEGTFTFSAILVKEAPSGKRNHEEALKGLRDFEIVLTRGRQSRTYRGCNWTRISIRSTLDQVTLDADISVPGYNPPVI